jgi:hypothetical protein
VNAGARRQALLRCQAHLELTLMVWLSDRSTSTGALCDRSTSTGALCDRSTSTGALCDRSTSTGALCDRSTSTGALCDRSRRLTRARDESLPLFFWESCCRLGGVFFFYKRAQALSPLSLQCALQQQCLEVLKPGGIHLMVESRNVYRPAYYRQENWHTL